MKYYFLLIIIVLLSDMSFSQIVFVPVNNEVYNYLDKLYTEEIIDINDAVKPYSRKYIAQKLIDASYKVSELTGIEKDQLEFYKKEYFNEIKLLSGEKKLPSLSYLSFGESDRFRFISYSDSLFSFIADPITSYDFNYRSSDKTVHGKNGIGIYGNIRSYLGFQLSFYDNTERGGLIDYKRDFSELTGYSFTIKRKNGIDYDDVTASLTYSWNWGDFSIMKDYLKWGSGRFGQIILSDKAPSFPMIKLSIHPIEWLNFDYMHGYLNSNVVDSSTIRYNVGNYRKHFENVPKYLAAHMLTVKPYKYLNLSIGESIVYSDRFEPIYLIPIIFFRIADHNNAANQASSGNVQLFSNISLRLPFIRSVIYNSLFIDEFSISDNDPSAIGYTLGYQIYDPFIKDCNFNIEYTKIDPFVYYHIDDAQSYSNYDYQLGHWIGSNGDQLCLSFEKNIIRGLNITAYWEKIRKGQKESRTEPRYQSWQTFLYGLRTNYTYWGINLKYEIIHSLIAKVDYRYSSIDHEQQDHTFINEKYSDFSFGLSFGL